jgi:hypothetical protein|tara:strand:- start:4651 stop:4800 length:150 start_codon:yes stop_codon:yes gene_type:complete
MTPPVVAKQKDLIEEYWKTKKEKEKKTVSFYEEYCAQEPWLLECKIFDL